MAHMACYCGASMSNVNCPSDNIIYVMRKQRVDNALAHNAEIKLIDFITNWDEKADKQKIFISDEYDFWYCKKCKRVYQCDIHIGGNKLASYKPIENYLPMDFNKLSIMEELIVFSDVEEDNAIETEPSVKLSSFIDSLTATRYFISNDHQLVYAYDCNANKVSFVYQSEVLLNQGTDENNK